MPSEAPSVSQPVTGRCYCGSSVLSFSAEPETVAYCHCTDCRRWTGAPVAGFAAFPEHALTSPATLGKARSHAPGVYRWNCDACGSPLAAQFDYLPDQIYVPVGLLDDIGAFPPNIHCHSGNQVGWLHIEDALPRERGSGRSVLSHAHLKPHHKAR